MSFEGQNCGGEAQSEDGRSRRQFRLRSCRVCNHVERARIEALRVGGISLRALELQFSVGKDAVHRHMRDHVSDARRSELLVGPAKIEHLINAAVDESRGYLEYLSIARSVLFNQFLAAAESGDRNGVVGIAGRLLEALRELGKLTGELRESAGTIINNNSLTLVTSPQFMALQEGLLKIARCHPETKGDIIALLRGLDERPTAPTKEVTTPPMIEGKAADAA
jgi:hypothetical protein